MKKKILIAVTAAVLYTLNANAQSLSPTTDPTQTMLERDARQTKEIADLKAQLATATASPTTVASATTSLPTATPSADETEKLRRELAEAKAKLPSKQNPKAPIEDYKLVVFGKTAPEVIKYTDGKRPKYRLENRDIQVSTNSNDDSRTEFRDVAHEKFIYATVYVNEVTGGLCTATEFPIKPKDRDPKDTRTPVNDLKFWDIDKGGYVGFWYAPIPESKWPKWVGHRPPPNRRK